MLSPLWPELIGRSTELEQLRSIYLRAEAGNGQLVVVTGTAGVGKSALVDEFCSALAGTRVIEVGAPELSASSVEVWQLLATRLHLRQGVPDVVEQGTTTDQLRDFADELVDLVTTGPALQNRVPAVLRLENLQWFSQASQRLLAHIVMAAQGLPLLIVSTHRTNYSPDNDNTSGSSVLDLVAHHVIPLDGLTEADLCSALGLRYPTAEPEQVQRAARELAELTAGNPLVVGETLNLLDRQHGQRLAMRHVTELSAQTITLTNRVAAAVEVTLTQCDPADLPVLGSAVLIGTFEVAPLAEATGTAPPAVSEAIQRGLRKNILVRTHGTITPVHPLMASALARAVDPQHAELIHARMFTVLTTGGRASLTAAVRHGIASGARVPAQRLAEVAVQAAQHEFSIEAYENTDWLLEVADNILQQLPGHSSKDRGELLLLRARANELLGDFDRAHDFYWQGATLANQLGDLAALTNAAIGFAFPPSWRIGTARDAIDLIEAARAAGADGVQEIQLSVLEAMLEFHVPRTVIDDAEWAWLALPSTAQPRAVDALARARTTGDDRTLALALLSWRWTHSAPALLCDRLAISTEALKRANGTTDAGLIGEACVRMIADCVEASDLATAREALELARWNGSRTLDPRLSWRIHTLEAMLAAATHDGEEFDRAASAARRIARRVHLPGAPVVEAMQLSHRVLLSGENAEILRLLEGQLHDLVWIHPLAMAAGAFGAASVGQTDRATELLDQALTTVHTESSYLHVLGWAAKACAVLQDRDRATRMVPLLEPWLDRAGVDGESIVSLGALGLLAAPVATLAGLPELSQRARAEGIWASDRLAGRAAGPGRCSGDLALADVEALTERELGVLQLIAAGRTNQQIAGELHLSLATVRRATTSSYRKLRVQGRPDAVAKATQLGLL